MSRLITAGDMYDDRTSVLFSLERISWICLSVTKGCTVELYFSGSGIELGVGQVTDVDTLHWLDFV